MPRSDETRFDLLYAREFAAVKAYAVRRAGPEVADDVVAETFTIAWSQIERLPAEPRPWLFGIARNVLRGQRRAQARQREIAERLSRERLYVPTTASDRELLLALASLSEADREVVLLICWEGLSTAEAARAMGTTQVAARVRLHRARRRLARRLQIDETPHVPQEET